MGKADRISGTFLFLFSLFIAVESCRMGLGTLRVPGPGFITFWAAVAVGIMSVAVVIRAWPAGGKGRGETLGFEKRSLQKIGLVILFLFLYAFTMESLGFIPVTLLLFALILGRIERKPWLLVAVVSIVVTAIAYLVFNIWLQSQLPEGIFRSLRY